MSSPANSVGPEGPPSQTPPPGNQPTVRREWGYSRGWRLFTVAILRPLLRLLMRVRWQGQENLPRSGAVILAPNHLSYADWGAVALITNVVGRRFPVFMIKSAIFSVKFIGPLMYKDGQLPVYRGRGDAGLVLKQAEQALATGACVVVYPEGTASRDPDQWPMVAKTGAARLALTTGAPVIPVAIWGAQVILPYGSKKPNLWPRKTVRMIVGPPVDLSAYAGQRLSASTLRAATADIMADITALLATIRQEAPPAEVWDPDVGGRVPALDRTDRGASAPSGSARPEAVRPEAVRPEAVRPEVVRPEVGAGPPDGPDVPASDLA
jgi:1-acyl-sn-glycerol-3-phosphate acyltransferase